MVSLRTKVAVLPEQATGPLEGGVTTVCTRLPSGSYWWETTVALVRLTALRRFSKSPLVGGLAALGGEVAVGVVGVGRGVLGGEPIARVVGVVDRRRAVSGRGLRGAV